MTLRLLFVMGLIACTTEKKGSAHAPTGRDSSVSPSVVLRASAEFVSGLVTLAATAENADRVVLLAGETVLAEAATYEWDTRSFPEGSYALKARAEGPGGVTDSAIVEVVVDRTPPKIVGSVPADGVPTTGVVVAVSISFDEPITAGRLELYRRAGIPVAGTLSIADRFLSLATAVVWGPDVLRIEVSEVSDRAGNVLARATLRASIPVRAGLGAPAPGDSVVLASKEPHAFIAYRTGGALAVKRIALASGDETSLGFASGAGSTEVSQPALVVAADGAPIVAFVRAASVELVRHDGQAFRPLPSPGVSGALDQPHLFFDASGTLHLSLRAGSRIVIRKWDGATWSAAGPDLDLGEPVQSYDAAFGADGGLVVVVADGQRKLAAHRLGRGWEAIGTEMQAAPLASVESPRLTFAGAVPIVAWAEQSEHQLAGAPFGRRNVYVARLGATWEKLGHALELTPKHDAFAPAIAATAAGKVYVAFREEEDSHLAVFDGEWRFVGGRQRGTVGLALDAAGAPMLALEDTTLVRVNADPSSPPFGLTARTDNTTCAIPEEIVDGTSIALLGCYADVASRTLIPAAVEYELVSPLWTDGADKRRAIVLPPGSTLAYKKHGVYGVPVGTILIKEFLWNGQPMETRFLVKRAEDRWNGYSFRWGGSTATLVESAGGQGRYGDHTHLFPSREQCLQCHNARIGFALGLQTANLDRSHAYAEATDHQLRAMNHIGMFDRAPGPMPPKMAAAEDATHSFALRSRTYLHTNCMHCHPGEDRVAQPAWGPHHWPLEHTNICDHNHIDEGTHETSVIWRRDQNFQRAGRMPPIGTLLPDPTNDILLRTWIDTMQPGDCPPFEGPPPPGIDD